MAINIRDQIRSIPLVGPLVDCRLRDHSEALTQTLIVLILSTAPLWLGALVIYAMSLKNDITFVDALLRTMAHGELFTYGTALLAPMFWVALVDPPGARVFPSKLPHMLLIALIEVIASVFFGLLIGGNPLRSAFTFHLSVAVFWLSLALLYLGTVYHTNRLPDASAAFVRDEKEFSEAYGEHRNEGQ